MVHTAYKKIDLQFSIHTEWIDITLQTGIRKDFYTRSSPGQVILFCPPGTDFYQPERQQWFFKVVERIIRQQATLLLPARLQQLSLKHNLPFKQVKINVSKGRWGSCSSHKNINLSCYLLMLPPHLVEFVMLHELSHTREMNHGPAVHALLNKLTDGQEKSLQKELRTFTMSS